MLQYDPRKQQYPGDSSMRSVTQLNKLKRKHHLQQDADGSISTRGRGRPKKQSKLVKTVTYKQYEEARGKGSNSSRLCKDITALTYHEGKTELESDPRNCVYCGGPAYRRCTCCPGKPYLHYKVTKGNYMDAKCWLNYHNPDHFGLGRDDRLMIGLTKPGWCLPTDSQVRQNRKLIQKYKTQYEENHN